MSIRIFFFLLSSSLFISCGKKEPADLVREFHQHLVNGEVEAIREQCTSQGKDQLDDYNSAYSYFGKSEKKEVASVNCSEGDEKITCWCEEVKGYVVQYELEKTDGKWMIDYKNFRPEVTAALFHNLMNEGEYIYAKDYSTENGKQSLSLLQSMNGSGLNGSETKKELASVFCEDENDKTTCVCMDKDGKENRYTMVKENGEWKVDYIKTMTEPMEPGDLMVDSTEMISSELPEEYFEE